MEQGSKNEAFPPFHDIKPPQRYDGKPQEYKGMQLLGCNYQHNHNSIRKKCGQYTLRDLNNNNKCYHNLRVGRRCLRAFGCSFEEGEEVLEWKFTLNCFSLIFVKGRKEGKNHFNTGLLNSTSPRGNLRPRTAASLRGPVLHHIKHNVAKTSYLEL